MNDLISRQAAIDACLKGKTDGLPATNVACDCCAERIRVLPSAQPEIIRCKDCKHSYETVGGRICSYVCSYGVCVDCVVRDDFYCSYGERKDG